MLGTSCDNLSVFSGPARRRVVHRASHPARSSAPQRVLPRRHLTVSALATTLKGRPASNTPTAVSATEQKRALRP